MTDDMKTHILPSPGKKYRHKKSGVVYLVNCIAQMEKDMETMVVYENNRSPVRVWIRPASEWWASFDETKDDV